MSGCVLRQSFEDTLTTQCSDVVADPEECSYLCAVHRYVTLHGAILGLSRNGDPHFSWIFYIDADT